MIQLSPPLDKMYFGCLSFNLTLIFMKKKSDSFGDNIGIFCTEILLAAFFIFFPLALTWKNC